jgi:hypothetical protein
MPRWRSYDFRCESEECGTVFPQIVDMAEDASSGEGPEGVHCPVCRSPAVRTISVPNITRASYVDGTDRGDAHRKLKEAAKLEKQAANMRPEKRSEIKKEINKLKKGV